MTALLHSTLSTAELRKSSCSTVPIKEDKSSYWIPVRPLELIIR
jgi:hypothetical protein